MQSIAFPNLSVQERRVIAFAIRGLGDKQIARAMEIAVETVRTYWVRIREKSGGVTRAEIVARHVQSLAQQEIDALGAENAALIAEVKRREVAEARLQGILDSMLSGAFFTDKSGSLAYVNRAWAEKMGVPYENALEFDLWNHIHEDDRERVRAMVRANIATRTPFREEYRLVREDGSVLWLSMRAGPMMAEDGDVSYVGTIDDVTLRREQEERVRRSAEELQALADLMPQLVLMADGQGICQFANAWAVRYFGRDLDGLRYGRWIQAIHPEDAPRVVPFFARSKDDLGPLEQAFRIRNAEDGTYRWHLARMRPEFGSDGELVRWIGVFDDIHDLHEAQERVERSEAVLLEAERIAKLGSYVYDDTDGTVAWSTEMYRIFDLDPLCEPLRDDAYFARVHPEDRDGLRTRLAEWELRGGEFRDEYRIVTPTGETRALSALACSEVKEGGRRVVGTLQDITERRRIKDALRKANASLRGAADASLDELYILRPLDAGDDFVFEFVNRLAEQHFGAEPGGLTGKPMFGTYPYESVRETVKILYEVLRSGEPYLGDHRGDLATTSDRWFRVQAARIDGGVAMTVSDATQVRRHEEELLEKMRLLHEAQVEIVLRQRELEDANVRLRELAHVDPLTGLKNKRRFLERIEAEQDLAVQYGHHFAVLTLDIDGMRDLNETHGHPAGDRVIEDVAAVLRHAMRPTDFVARLGGGRFAALVLESDHATAEAAAEAIRLAVERHPWPYGAVTVSVGAACCDGDVESADAIADRSLRAMEAAKRTGRNRVVAEATLSTRVLPS